MACQSTANDCGVAGVGSIVCATDGLSSACDAAVPPNPPGYGESCASAPNACGATTSGTIQCDGSCDAEPPAAVDSDGDGTPDCNDQCANDPAKTEPGVCGCGEPETLITFYRDADGDGFGDASNSTEACAAPRGYVANATDCNDGNASVHPGAAELCNGIDDDCNGQSENVDADNDGVNDCGADACPGSKADAAYAAPVPSKRLLNNHWVLASIGGVLQWVTEGPVKPNEFQPTLAYSDGCSCKQILDALRALTGNDMNGQYFYGCTKGTLKDWNGR
jgi:hypothetical protein